MADDTDLYLSTERSEYRPGETIEGEVLWVLEEEPEKMELSLGWWTEGRGTRDSGIEAEEKWDCRDRVGKRHFSFKIPAEAPYSFEGSLITLRWALEIRPKKGRRSFTLPLVVGPASEPISLGKVEDDPKKRAPFRSFFPNRR